MSSGPTLGYWPVRAFGQPIRLLLKYSGVEFNDKRYKMGEGNTFKDIQSIRKYWLPEKFNLGLDFPNLPYYIDGDIKLSQSLVILRYLGRKHGLVATDEKSIIRQELVEQQLADARIQFMIKILLAPEFDKQNVLNETIIPQLEQLDKFLGSGDWFVGTKLTYVDFFGYETLDWFRLFSPETVAKYKNLSNFLNRFENLPAIKNYMNSSEFLSWPIFGAVAKWGYKK